MIVMDCQKMTKRFMLFDEIDCMHLFLEFFTIFHKEKEKTYLMRILIIKIINRKYIIYLLYLKHFRKSNFT
jgi:hypothetical protein